MLAAKTVTMSCLKGVQLAPRPEKLLPDGGIRIETLYASALDETTSLRVRGLEDKPVEHYSYVLSLLRGLLGDFISSAGRQLIPVPCNLVLHLKHVVFSLFEWCFTSLLDDRRSSAITDSDRDHAVESKYDK